MCRPHYGRWKRSGSTDGIRSLRGAAERYFNETVLKHDGDECLIWPFVINNGYGRFTHEGEMQYVHLVVCERVNGPPPTQFHQAAHSCGKGKQGCVTKRHLSWKTRTENEADKLEHGTHNRGGRHPLAKLSEIDARRIVALKGVVSQSRLAAEYGITREAISSIHQGRTWGWL
ncbi:hypothetical protein CIT31_16695 [Mesorhizobium wenxiniae]|uniref:HNH nuclease domain-containing protein n=1 Tax=Mesorhizobium wenxiniae TaxID=2014805 RepID=A0A271KEW0_9HYPH|nr:hypothetical protein CIT31_16695 [Mesorhizobium wenxiniae]